MDEVLAYLKQHKTYSRNRRRGGQPAGAPLWDHRPL